MNDPIILQVRKTGLIEKGDCILVGLSGGPDSVCLLHVLVSLADQFGLTLFAAHLNHNLRGLDANEDAAFAMRFAKSMDIHCLVKSEQVEDVARNEKLSLEEAGRKCRYRFLDEVAAKIDANKIAVAHHLNDQAETVLLHLIRGAGLSGLAGMKRQRERLIRPLLGVSRKDIMAYCARHELPYCLDSTNDEPVVRRNRIRLEIIPMLESINPQLVESLGRTAALIREDEMTLNDMADEWVRRHGFKEPDAYRMDKTHLLEQPEALVSRIIRLAYREVSLEHHTLQWVHVNQMQKALDRQGRERWFQLPGGVRALFTRDEVIFYSKPQKTASTPSMPEVVLKNPGITWLPQRRGRIRCCPVKKGHPLRTEHQPWSQLIAADHLSSDLTVRTRLPGDRWQPLGLQGTKSLRKTFIDWKLSQEVRDQCLLVCHEDQILWVVGQQVSETVRITENTQKKLLLEYAPED